jgi:hypothetical protein
MTQVDTITPSLNWLWLTFPVFALDAAGFLYQAWCLSMLWGWFIEPLGLPALSFAQGAGLLLVASLIQTRLTGLAPKRDKKPDDEKPWRFYLMAFAGRIGKGFSRPTFLLAAGYLIRALAQ